MPFFTKELSKEIMTRSRLRNKYLKNRYEENRATYVKQRNYCASLLQKSKKKYYENLHERNLMDNKLFWKTIKPSFSDKLATRDRIHLIENGEVVKTELETAETLNNFFGNVIKNPMIPKYSEYNQFSKKVGKIKKTIGQSAFYQSYQKYLKKLCSYRCLLFFEDIFNKQQCGFRKGYKTQQCLLKMLEKWKQSVDGGKVFGALLTHLSKAFDCLDHELLIAKLNVYGFSLPALRLINDYLSNRRQRIRIGNSFSDWFKVILGVPQGPILGPLFLIYSSQTYF